jgi:hypothetical protein
MGILGKCAVIVKKMEYCLGYNCLWFHCLHLCGLITSILQAIAKRQIITTSPHNTTPHAALRHHHLPNPDRPLQRPAPPPTQTPVQLLDPPTVPPPLDPLPAEPTRPIPIHQPLRHHPPVQVLRQRGPLHQRPNPQTQGPLRLETGPSQYKL